MFFQGWEPILRIIVAATLGYIALVAALRVSGKRTLSKMNAFDLVITVTLGSTLATLILNKDVAILESVTAFVMLCGLQYVTSWLSVRYAPMEKLIKASPTLLLHQGKFAHDAMRRVRITESEVRAAIRNQGLATTDVQAVVLETDGQLTVVNGPPGKGTGALSDVVGFEQNHQNNLPPRT